MSFWADQRVLVTGGAGFLGSFIVDKLREKNPASIFIPRSADYDLRDRNAVIRCLRDSNPTLVIHAAAVVGGIGANLQHPAKFFYENAIMGLQLIEEARHHGVEKFVCLGTICAYPKLTPIPFREEELWNGYPEETNAPYGLAKKMLLVQLQSYRHEYGFEGVYLLPVNLYGPRDNFDLETSHVIPALIRKFFEAHAEGKREVILWGDGTPTREFLYVEDAAIGILMAAECYKSPDPVNLGSGEETSIRELAQLIAGMIGYSGDIIWDTSQPNGQPRRKLDTGRAKALFGFESQTPFGEGLRQTIEWYSRKQS